MVSVMHAESAAALLRLQRSRPLLLPEVSERSVIALLDHQCRKLAIGMAMRG
jgi:hypothetical protein